MADDHVNIKKYEKVPIRNTKKIRNNAFCSNLDDKLLVFDKNKSNALLTLNMFIYSLFDATRVEITLTKKDIKNSTTSQFMPICSY